MYNSNQRHKCFISYHHEDDQYYKDKFVRLFDDYLDIFIDKSVGEGEINDDSSNEYIMQQIRDKYLSDSSVTIVLIGTETWKRKFVDWEISASIRKTPNSPRSGLIGIILPTHSDFVKTNYTANLIPPRLYDNANNGFAKIYDWTEDPNKIQTWINEAFERKDLKLPINTRTLFRKNRTGDSWSD